MIGNHLHKVWGWGIVAKWLFIHSFLGLIFLPFNSLKSFRKESYCAEYWNFNWVDSKRFIAFKRPFVSHTYSWLWFSLHSHHSRSTYWPCVTRKVSLYSRYRGPRRAMADTAFSLQWYTAVYFIASYDKIRSFSRVSMFQIDNRMSKFVVACFYFEFHLGITPR